MLVFNWVLNFVVKGIRIKPHLIAKRTWKGKKERENYQLKQNEECVETELSFCVKEKL